MELSTRKTIQNQLKYLMHGLQYCFIVSENKFKYIYYIFLDSMAK